MVSEVASKSFDSKNENLEEDNKSNLNENRLDVSQERVEPSFIDNSEKKSINSASYEGTFGRGLATDDDQMNIPSFLRRNRD